MKKLLLFTLIITFSSSFVYGATSSGTTTGGTTTGGTTAGGTTGDIIGGTTTAGSASVSSVSGYTCTEVTSNTAILQEDTSLSPITSSYCSGTDHIGYYSRQSGGTISTSYKKTYCTGCKTGYGAKTLSATSTRSPGCRVTWTTCVPKTTIIPPCDGLTCEGYTGDDWLETTLYRETQCNEDTDTCVYRCKSGYYNISGGASVSCSRCPTNGVCTEGIFQGCVSNHYWINMTTTGGSLRPTTTYTCNLCPGLPTPSGSTVYGNTDPNSSAYAITGCYMPTGTSFQETSGVYEFTSKCNYSE